MQDRPSRRGFVKTLAAGAGYWVSSATPAAAIRVSSNEKLNIGFVGVGGRGETNLNGLSGHNVVALCDVDEKRASLGFARFPKAKRYADYRRMLEREKSLDAVVVTTPDHMHAPAARVRVRARVRGKG